MPKPCALAVWHAYGEHPSHVRAVDLPLVYTPPAKPAAELLQLGQEQGANAPGRAPLYRRVVRGAAAWLRGLWSLVVFAVVIVIERDA